MKYMDDLKHKLCEEVDSIAKKGDISMSDLEKLHKMTDTIKNLEKIKMYEQYADDGEDDQYSERRGRGRNARRDSMGRYSRDDGGSYRGSGGSYAEHGGSYDGGSYDGGSYARDGGSSYRQGGYSRAEGKEQMMQKLEEMMEHAGNVRERETLDRCMRELKNMQ